MGASALFVSSLDNRRPCLAEQAEEAPQQPKPQARKKPAFDWREIFDTIEGREEIEATIKDKEPKLIYFFRGDEMEAMYTAQNVMKISKSFGVRPVMVDMQKDEEPLMEILIGIKGDQTKTRFPDSSFLMMNRFDDYHYFPVD